MLFKLMAPFYDKFMHKVALAHTNAIPEWLEPLKGREVLDLGGGTGINVAGLVAAGAIVTLVDSSPAMLRRASLKGLPARLLQADAACMPFPGDSFDIILISDAWHHFRNQAAVSHEAIRVLRRGGRIYIIDLDPASLQTRLVAFVERLFAEPATFTSPKDLVAQLQAMGIVGACRYLNNYQYLFEGVKM